MSYIVTAPLVITRNENKSDLYLYQGTQVPSHVSKDELARLLADDLISKVDEGEGDKPATRAAAKK